MRYLLVLILLASLSQLRANTYYFSTLSGDDARSSEEAQQAATPWKTLAKLNAVFGSLKPGDIILFKRDEIFEGSIVASRSGSSGNPIVFGAFGSGAKPVITGLTNITNWSNIGSGIWEGSCSSGTMINTVIVNGLLKDIGRYPNLSAPGKGYLTIKSSIGNSQITDNELASSPDWTGGDVVIRKARWVLDRNLITRHSGSTIEYRSESGYGASPLFGYFIQNHPKTLDLPGEWYYRLSDQKLGIYFESGNPSSASVQASTVGTLVNLNNLSNFVFDNLSFTGANNAAFEMINTQQVRISNCELFYSGVDAVNAKNTDGLTIENSFINHSYNVALNLDNCSNLIIRNCIIKNSGTTAGMGKGDSGSYEAILLTGNNVLIEQNEIDSTGYIAITFRGNLNEMKNNFINNYALVKDDAAGIYTWNNIPNSPVTYGTKITSNIILNGKGAPEGTEWPTYSPASGIYMDDNTFNTEITGNTIAQCGLHGIYIHNAHSISIERNTLYNSSNQLVLTQDVHAAQSKIRNMKVFHNIFFAKDFYFRVADFRTDENDISQFGEFDYNFYCRPTFDNEVIFPAYRIGGAHYDKGVTLEQWKAMYGKDLNSKKSPVELFNADLIRFEYNTTATTKSIALDGEYIDVYNNSYTGSVDIEPFSSRILMKHAPGKETTPVSSCPGTGSITREQWDNIGGNDITTIPLTTAPSKIAPLTVFETFNSGEMFGARISGYICPPVSGSYTFLIAGDDQAALWLSTDDNPANKQKIANFQTWTAFREYKKYPSQTSVPINLQAGQRYYIEVLHKEGDVGDHVSVAWQLPSGLMEIPIPGSRLLPITTTVTPPVVTNGLNYRYYEGDWNMLPDFNTLTPVKTGTTPNVDISVRNPGVNNHFGFVWEGSINIPTAGTYTFETVSDDGSKLYFNSLYSFGATALVDYDGLHAAWPTTGTVNIPAPGIYPISIAYFEKDGGELMEVYWSGPGIPRQRIPDIAFTGNPLVITEGCPGTGSILHEQWGNIAGNDIPNIPLGTSPGISGQLNMLETSNVGDMYGERMRGYICPPQSGAYTFSIAGDDAVELWLSTNDNPANKTKIASLLSWTNFHQFDKYASQKSPPVNLQAGQRYYIEVLHKEGGGGDHVTVAWQLPGGVTEMPIRGNRLMPYTNASMITSAEESFRSQFQQGKDAAGGEWQLNVFPNPFKVSSTIVFNTKEPGELVMELYDLQGRKLQRFPTRKAKPGVRETFVLQADGLKAGVYFIRLSTKTKVMFRKIILTR
ncbi:MAG: PA14 domain-containing protein [Chitinophagaceae bacterium]